MAGRTFEIADNVFWVGGDGAGGSLHCNPYLIVEGDEGILIDPGSVLDFESVYKSVTSIIPIERIKYVILHHQDPDFCSGVPLFENKGACFKIITHWRAQVLIQFYGVKSDYYIINENNLRFTFATGRVLEFILTPYLHFPGAFTTYDPQNKILFSSDLFGAFSNEWELFDDESYIERMKAFHEHYMPSNEILRPVMELYLKMDISMIAPQHGSVIKNNVKACIKALRDLECGSLMNPIRKSLADAGGYGSICSSVLKRFAVIYSAEDVREAVSGLELNISEAFDVNDYDYTGDQLWNLMFEKIMVNKGIRWLTVIEPFVRKLSKQFEINMPIVFESNLKIAEETSLELDEQNQMLSEINSRLGDSLRKSEDKLIRCPVTGLYNYAFFKNYLASQIDSIIKDASDQNPGIILLSIDDIERIESRHGSGEVDSIFKNTAYILEETLRDNAIPFRLFGAAFAVYVPQAEHASIVEYAEGIRTEIEASGKFLEHITASIGVVTYDEIKSRPNYAMSEEDALYNAAVLRQRLARNMGANNVCSSSALEEYYEKKDQILIVDSDEISVEVLKTALENNEYTVLTAEDGSKALEMIEKSLPAVIISEIMLPKTDGFMIRKILLSKSNSKNIPFIILSNLKNEESVIRAASLGIEIYIKKPFMPAEIVGIVKNKTKGERDYGR